MLAIYAFSGDPITNGHINIVERAASTFERVIVAIGSNPSKKYLFPLEIRVAFARQALAHIRNVEVMSFTGMLSDFAYEQNARILVRGIRNSTDYDYEQMLSAVTESQKLGLDTYFLFADPELLHISSSSVKAIQKEHGSLDGYVPLPVKVGLERVMSKQTIIGVTGSIACGKSTLCEKLVQANADATANYDNPRPGKHIDLDKLVHELLDADPAPYAVKMRQQLIDHFGESISDDGDIINRAKLAPLVFGRGDALHVIRRITAQPIMVRLRKALYGVQGLIVIEGALLAETGMLSFCNNHIVLVDVDRTVQMFRLKQRGNSDAAQRIASQWDGDRKAEAIEAAIHKDRYGKLWRVSGDDAFNIPQLLYQIESHIDQKFNEGGA